MRQVVRWFGRLAIFEPVIAPLSARERCERLIGAIGEGECGDYALIAASRGPMPKMFMTRVRL